MQTMTQTITTDECRECAYGEILEESKRAIKVHCSYRNRTYFFGQRIPCEDKKREGEKG